jgi:hypothetical protein
VAREQETADKQSLHCRASFASHRPDTMRLPGYLPDDAGLVVQELTQPSRWGSPIFGKAECTRANSGVVRVKPASGRLPQP